MWAGVRQRWGIFIFCFVLLFALSGVTGVVLGAGDGCHFVVCLYVLLFVLLFVLSLQKGWTLPWTGLVLLEGEWL